MTLRARSTLFLAAALAAACGREARPGLPPRNVVLVTIEGLRADHVSGCGYPRPTTSLPSDATQRALGRAMGIDDLAAAGVLFAQAYAPSGSTTASLATILTGRAPREAGVVDDGCAVPREVPTLASILSSAGFETVAFVSAQRLPLARTLGRGFARIEARPSDAETVDAAIEWLRRDFGSDRPLFLWLHLAAPEPPFVSPGAGAVAGRFGDPGYRGPVDGSRAVLERAARGELTLSPADRARVVDLYDGGIAGATAELGRFLRKAFDFHGGAAEGSEAWARTLLVLASPHGTELFERGGVGHSAGLHDAELHVPLFLRHPDSLTGERVMAEVVELADVAPTILDWFECETPEGVSGRSLLPLVDSYVQRPFERRPAFAVNAARVYTARTPRWRLILDPATPATRLYDHELDPLELVDVSAAWPEVVEELTTRTRGFAVALVARQREPRRIEPAAR